MLKIQLNNSNHRRIEFTEKSSQSRFNKITATSYNVLEALYNSKKHYRLSSNRHI